MSVRYKQKEMKGEDVENHTAHSINCTRRKIKWYNLFLDCLYDGLNERVRYLYLLLGKCKDGPTDRNMREKNGI